MEPAEQQISPEDLRDLVLTLLDDRSGTNLVALDVRKSSGFTDYMVIVTGTSARHVKTLAGHVMEETKARGASRLGVEGLDSLEWVLIDLADVVVHVMRESARKYYDLERMWERSRRRRRARPKEARSRDVIAGRAKKC